MMPAVWHNPALSHDIWVLANGFTINPSHANWSIQVANVDTIFVSGTMDIEVTVQGFKQVIRFLVIPMAKDMDLVIGNDWIHKHKSVLDYEQSTVSFWHNGKRLVSKPTGAHQSVKRVLEAAREREADDANHGAGEDGNVQIHDFVKAKKIIRVQDDWTVLQLHHVGKRSVDGRAMHGSKGQDGHSGGT
jgi:hypothetical protein